MKKKRIIIWSVITPLTIIAALQVFDLHPGLNLGKYRVSWVGVRDMVFTTGLLTGNGSATQIYGVGPIVIFIPT